MTAQPAYSLNHARQFLHVIVCVVLITLAIAWVDAGVVRPGGEPTEIWACNNGFEMPAPNEEPDTTSQEAEKEIKDLFAPAPAQPFVVLLLTGKYKFAAPFVFPQPMLNRHKPPPNPTC